MCIRDSLCSFTVSLLLLPFWELFCYVLAFSCSGESGFCVTQGTIGGESFAERMHMDWNWNLKDLGNQDGLKGQLLTQLACHSPHRPSPRVPLIPSHGIAAFFNWPTHSASCGPDSDAHGCPCQVTMHLWPTCGWAALESGIQSVALHRAGFSKQWLEPVQLI